MMNKTKDLLGDHPRFVIARVSGTDNVESWLVYDTANDQQIPVPTGLEEVANYCAGLYNMIDSKHEECGGMYHLLVEASNRIGKFRTGQCELVALDGLTGMQVDIFMHLRDFSERNGLPPMEVKVMDSREFRA